MIRNYIKISFRNLNRFRVFSIINVSGLAIGLACCLVITLYIKEELSYDSFHARADKTYRITREFFSPDGSTSLHLAHVAPPVGPLFKNDFAEEIETIGRIVVFGGTIQYEDKLFNEPDIAFADNEIFEIFSFDFIHGNPKSALAEAGSMVITDQIAMKYFGKTDVVGEVLRFSDQTNFRITGVIKELPTNSHFEVGLIGDFGVVESYYGGRENLMANWGGNNFATYFVLHDGHTIQTIKDRVPDFLKTHIGEDAPTWTNLQFMRLTDIHLYSHLDDEIMENGDIKYIYSFAGIAILILLIACINYMNLTTARSASRAKEVGMRKVMGAVRSNLINQFLAESILLVMISVLIAIALTGLVLPPLRELTGNSFPFSLQNDLMLVAVVVLFTVVIGVLAGSYPAFYLSSYQPVSVLKGKLNAGAKGLTLRRGLVVVQFTISVILIVSTVLIFQQIQFMQTKDLGLNKDHVLILNSNRELGQQFQTFRTELLKNPAIRKVAGSRRIPSGRLLDSGGAEAQVGDEMITPTLVIKDLPIDYHFLDAYELKLVAGRSFSKDISTDDTAAYVLNQAAVKSVGWSDPNESLDKDFTYRGNRGKIIGVVQDSHFESLHNRIAPLVMYINEDEIRYLSIKVTSSNIQETVGFIEELYSEFSPSTPIVYNFLDDRFNELYQNERMRSQLYSAFSFLAIFLACLGVFGLASFTSSQRGKEISIRKVLGATIAQIVYLLSKEFVVLIVISFGIAFPIVYYFMSGWLENFAYKVNIGLWPFVGAGFLALAIAMGTISFQTIKAALSNPVDALRNE